MTSMGKPGPDELDQEHAFLIALAPVTRGYFDALLAAGFDPAQAMYLTSRWQDNYLAEVRRASRAPGREESS